MGDDDAITAERGGPDNFRRKQPSTKVFSLRLTSEIHNTLELIATVENISMNSVIEVAIANYLEDLKKNTNFQERLRSKIEKDLKIFQPILDMVGKSVNLEEVFPEKEHPDLSGRFLCIFCGRDLVLAQAPGNGKFWIHTDNGFALCNPGIGPRCGSPINPAELPKCKHCGLLIYKRMMGGIGASYSVWAHHGTTEQACVNREDSEEAEPE